MAKQVMSHIIIVAAPSGGGKNSFIQKALLDLPQLKYIVSYTTRHQRAGEKDGHPYHFVEEKTFHHLCKEGFFVEWAKVHGHWYGTPKQAIEEACQEGKTPITDLDIQGAKTVKKHFPQSQSIFILPPSLEELRQRILKRDGEKIQDTQDLVHRLERAQKEIEVAHSFDFQLTNKDFNTSYKVFKKIVQKIIDHFKNLD